MVGKDEGGGNNCQDVPSLRDASKRAGLLAEGAGISKCGHQALAQGARSAQNPPHCNVAAKALAAYKFYDPWASLEILEGCAYHPAPCPVFHHWMVHGLKEIDNRRIKMVDGQS